MCMETKGKATATCYPQAIGTYVPLSRGLHQLGSSFLPHSRFIHLPPISVCVAKFSIYFSSPSRYLLCYFGRAGVGEMIIYGSGGALGLSFFGYHTA